MKWLLGTYAGRFNRRHKLFGHLFSGRYKALVVDGSGDGYLKTVCDYVQLNPARAKFLAPEVPLRDYAWSNSSKRRPQEIRGGGAASGGNGRNRGVDRGAVAGGSPRVSQPLLYCQLY